MPLNAQRGVRAMRGDSIVMNRIQKEAPEMGMMMHRPDSARMRRMMPGMGNPWMSGHDRFMPPMGNMRRFGPGMGMMGPGMWRPGMGMMRPGMYRPGMGMNQAPGMRILNNIPNLTDKQKKDITDIRQKQMEEMQKIRNEMQEKMKAIRQSDRTKIMNLLNDEQKKWFEKNVPAPPAK